MLVRDELIPIRAVSASAVLEFLKEFDPVPVELREACAGHRFGRIGDP